MTTPSIPGFTGHRVSVDNGVTLKAAVGGSGTPVVLLHGFPQTHLMWRHVAADLAADHTVICPDLRGYGASDKPVESGPDVYSKRTMARDVVRLAAALGHDRFTLAGHDRGALVAFRAAMDHPGAVSRALFLDVLPTLDMWDALRGVNGAVGFHLYLMAQAPGLPEEMIQGAADTFFSYFLDAWTKDPDALPANVRAHYLAASAAAVPSIVADYRASAGVDVDHDTTDKENGNKLTMPVTVLQQDWGTALGYHAQGLWSAWTGDLRHQTVSCGHFMAEEDPQLIASEIRALTDR
ncbi:alpha/beta hydrolase [Streptomyces globisporus]|uniref:Hydrolase n=1 Tax=Streptomyces globisporus TaxID=1908 RepID=A0ABM9H419_STRGL|nr:MULTISPECIES: alpha/beta hydrolase [Streptomyces]PVD08978.1 alpha/beta hydrolase [Streptomyces sp. CS147]RDL04466.1 pimeloyl-ACP methyl ester carboxylesterase [Streptomyces sp. HB202]WSQ95438.1 alpha/beta hydrolase [Streptomyces globisporus]WSV93404.1 alpha/beta hydrolase [Streptomyces globisporus]CAH9418369.1 Hydrolase [Streptomyces globisporus]